MGTQSAKSAKKSRVGIALIILGAIIWLLPFFLVAVDNAAGDTGIADSVINNYGFLLIGISPILVLIGIILVAAQYIKRVKL